MITQARWVCLLNNFRVVLDNALILHSNFGDTPYYFNVGGSVIVIDVVDVVV